VLSSVAAALALEAAPDLAAPGETNVAAAAMMVALWHGAVLHRGAE